MNTKQMDKLIAHCNLHFDQGDPVVLHQDGQEPHVDILRYPPNEKYPYWKLVTMGASDYLLPKTSYNLGRRNEYIMFVEPDVDLNKPENVGWYAGKLHLTACYAIMEKVPLSYGHSMEWSEEEGSDMVGAFLEMPQLIEDVAFLRCKLGLMKETVILQTITLTRPELERMLEMGPRAFSEWIYPEDGGDAHVLTQRNRTDAF